MNVLLYTPESKEAENRLQNFLESHVPGCKTEVYRTIEGLAERLKAPNEGQWVAVLQAYSRKDLEALLSLAPGLKDLKTILLVPDRDGETISLAHRLRPRFLSDVNSDLHEVAAVLEKMRRD